MVANMSSKNEQVGLHILLISITYALMPAQPLSPPSQLQSVQVVDTRAAGRFNGTAPEPNPSDHPRTYLY